MEISVETLGMQQEANPELDIIPDLNLGEYEQMQSQSSGDIEILEEQLHIEGGIQSQQHEEKEGQGSVTQELAALHSPFEVTANNQVDKKIKIQEEVVPQEPTSLQSATEVAIGELQKEDVVTKEPTSPEVVSGLPMVEVVVEEIPRRDVVTQELAPREVISEVQDVQCGTSGDKVWIQLPQNFINLDSNKEEHLEEEES